LKWRLSRARALEAALLLLVIAAAVARRIEFLDYRSFWVDEAESSINALTILQHGVPVDHYLGIPIYENTLVKRWPGNPEYEFKDISYSDRGLATYHGWLPLYSIAASFALHHISPDEPSTNFSIHRGLEAWKRWSRAGRMPSVVFSAIFLVICYVGGTWFMGRDAGWTALLVGCVHQTQLDVSTTARYYSATVMLSTLVALCLWLVATKGEWKHHLLAACAFMALFFTHLITFVAGASVLCALAPIILWRQRGSLKNLTGFGLVLSLAIVPWILSTGFLSGLGAVPPARLLLSFPSDFFEYPLARPIYFVSFGALIALLIWSWRVRSGLPERVTKPLRRCSPAVAILSLWIVAGYLSFMLFMPAGSFFVERLNLSYWGPTLLLGSIFAAVISRMVSARYSIILAPALAFVLLGITGHDLRGEPSPDHDAKWGGLVGLAEYLNHQAFPAGTRLYASPNQHLVLTLYMGLPFQSVAPVRRSFLDSYKGDIVYAEPAAFLASSGALSPASLQRTALSSGERLSDLDAQRVSWLLRTVEYQSSVNQDMLGFPKCSGPSLPSFAAAALGRYHADIAKIKVKAEPIQPVFRGFHVQSAQDWRGVFFYRFVNPLSRTGRNLNYADRLRGADADLLVDAGWAVFHSKFAESRPQSPVRFTLVATHSD
jgi:hypothetical protein